MTNEIPVDWMECKLKELAFIDKNSLNGDTSSNYQFHYISLADVNEGAINPGIQYYKFSQAPSRARRIVKCGDILLATVRPNLEGFALVKIDNKDLIASTGFSVLTPKDPNDTEYIYQYLFSYKIRRQIYGLVVGSNYPALNSSDVKNLRFLLPKELNHRKRIADILTIWDEAIEKTEKLIELKEKKFKSISNALLFGKNYKTTKATKWFNVPNHWKLLKIKDVAKEVKEKNGTHEDIPVLSCTKYDGLVDSLKYFDKRIYSEDTSQYKIVKYGWFAYATNHIEEGSIGYLDLYPAGLVSPMYTVFKTTDSIDDGYLYKLLKTETFRHIFEVNTSASVDRRGSLRWNYFSKLPIPFPPLEEQIRINTILQTFKAEIDLLKNLLEAYKTQKRGLMQKLLTGKWQVKVN